MTSINLIAKNRIPESYRSVVGFYPDVILFQLNQHQFQTKWQQLARAPYIYTNGFSLRPAGWFRYYFESFKGWLGFTNHCNPQLLQLSLRKLAYYGYLHGYQPIHQIVKYPLGSGFLSVVNQERNPANSLQLQTDLINYYSEHSFYFPQFEMMAGVASPSRFGTSFATLGLCDLVPCLDPQDNHIIDEVSKVLEPHSYQKYSFFRGSRYAKTVAQQYLAQALQEKKAFFIILQSLIILWRG